VNDVERYLFDLRGYMVVKRALTPARVAELNEVVDDRGIPELLEKTTYVHTGFPDDEFNRGNQDPVKGPVDVALGLLLDWGRPVRALVDNPAISSHLAELLGPHFRLDHCYAIFMAKDAGAMVPHHLHNAGTPFDPTQSYLVRDGRMHNAMCVVSYALTDVPPGSGGFCCIPGSHKSCFPLPASVAQIVDETPPVEHIPVEAGDAIIFTEAVTHGAIAWRGAEPRRSLLFKFCAGHLQWERDSPLATLDLDWTDQERRVLSNPYAGQRPRTLAAPEPAEGGG
jgi:ectoine hydroxylase-related dioxygenase (phytanoyl-CoA dioxygenase family)